MAHRSDPSRSRSWCRLALMRSSIRAGLQRRCVASAYEVHRMDHARDDDPFGASATQRTSSAPARFNQSQLLAGFCAVRGSLRRVPRRAFGGAHIGSSGLGAQPALSDRRTPNGFNLAAVLDRAERDQDDGHAVVARLDVRGADLERGGVARGEHEAAARRRYTAWRSLGVCSSVSGPWPRSRITFHSSSVTGATDRRDWRMSSILASRGSALISLSVTGRANGWTGSTRTETQLESSGQAGPRGRSA